MTGAARWHRPANREQSQVDVMVEYLPDLARVFAELQPVPYYPTDKREQEVG